MRRPSGILAAPLLSLPALAAADEGESPLDRVQVGAYADVFYSYNPEFPETRSNFPVGFGPTAKRANEFGVNLAAVDLAVDPEPIGLRLIFSGGTFAEVIHASEVEGEGVGADVFRYVQQANVTWKVSDRLLLDAGLLPSPIGFESIWTRDNIDYTHAWVSDLTPYYLTGLRAHFTLSDQWTAHLLLVNGWQRIGDNNDGKSVVGQVAWAEGPASIAVSGFAGPELDGDDEHWRFLGDLVAQLHATPWLFFATQVDLGWQQRHGLDAASWEAAALWAKATIAGPLYLGARGELIHDPEGVISGTGQRIEELTATLGYTVADELLLKLEGRHDWSTAAIFPGDTAGALRREQSLAVLGAVASF